MFYLFLNSECTHKITIYTISACATINPNSYCILVLIPELKLNKINETFDENRMIMFRTIVLKKVKKSCLKKKTRFRRVFPYESIS